MRISVRPGAKITRSLRFSRAVGSAPDTTTSVTLYPFWQRGQPAALDVTVISTLQQCIVEGAAVTQGYALAVGEERK